MNLMRMRPFSQCKAAISRITLRVFRVDNLHGQIGGAWNGVELHPVLKVAG